ncbi:MAG: histidinol-phosphatase family [Bacteroidales bacterium]|jgi:histidinol-phosphatase (PHP family)|nr:histidinol-phosphatase family [Bacteroidales bacterium]MDN5328319.1 histidinol-phosphatase family [Bacteroidales bacterium]
MYCYHTHTHFCDGSSHPEDYVKEALRLGFHSLGFSGHAPVPFENKFAIPENRIQEYCDTILHLKEKYKDHIQIFLGLEIDGIPGIMPSFHHFRETYRLDYTIGSVHLVKNPDNGRLWFIDGAYRETYDKGLQRIMNGDIRRGVTLYYRQIQQMIYDEKPDIVGHLDKICMHNAGRYFSKEEEWYQHLVFETLEIIKQTGCIIEINTRGIYKGRSKQLYPDAAWLSAIKEKEIPVTISSDAHQPGELSLLYEETLHLLQREGFRKIFIKGLECYQ